MTNAFLDFDFTINSENLFDGVQVLANDRNLAGFTGNGGGHARYSLAALTQPGVIGNSVIAFDFTSDFAVTGGGFQLDNLTITGDLMGGPAGAVPEPATWAMMLIGFTALGAAMRGRRSAGLLARV